MNCKEVNKLIPLFWENEINGKELKEFMNHIMSCPECKEELSIQFLVMEGVASLENGSTFDLQKELDRHIEAALRKMKMRKWLHIIVYGIEISTIVAIITIIILLMIL